ncbi:2-phosphosulfolactate phosphatase [Actinoplanes sp. OR16]|uniref:2-phosphosulfolactate phosphatase n=1 Tax=Actinoplanes sp. OR16 TaxID=946334 RepID=UPI000FD887DD|nr:2-phosphosulfolactate phosphatase [Actinoplanes sp. OR16]
MFSQGDYDVRFDWGPTGALAIAGGAAFVAVIDVLSFTTALTVAVDHGAAVLPYRWRDASAAETAARHRAVLAVGRSVAGPGEVSLSPATIAEAASRRPIERLVLPSPNGSTIAASLDATGATVVGVSLRNAPAAAAWVRSRAAGRPIAVVAAGERWPDTSLRPAPEDLWGAGAFLHHLSTPSVPSALRRSPEAGVAIAAYRAVATDLPAALAATASGRELTAGGYHADVEVAAAFDASTSVPVLQDGWFRQAGV